jgi:hypothetical protein
MEIIDTIDLGDERTVEMTYRPKMTPEIIREKLAEAFGAEVRLGEVTEDDEDGISIEYIISPSHSK